MFPDSPAEERDGSRQLGAHGSMTSWWKLEGARSKSGKKVAVDGFGIPV